jgi:Tol biopolymer transport system component
MKIIPFLILFISLHISAQINTEVHFFDIKIVDENYVLKNGQNISNNPDYDSQPFFYDDNNIIFASTRNKSTDILIYNLKDKTKRFISDTKNGSEYSPQRIPNSKNISAVRLDDNGLQRFYQYDFISGKSSEIIPDLKVAYPNWFDKNILAAVSIVNDSLELFICDLKKKINVAVAKNVGRSVHRIPNSNLISFISKEHKESWLIKSLNPLNTEIKTITSIGTSEDVTWLPNGILLISKGNSIYKFHPQKDKTPNLFFSFSDKNINNISRMAVNANGTKIALVAEVSK